MTADYFQAELDSMQAPVTSLTLNWHERIAQQLGCPEDYTIELLDSDVLEYTHSSCDMTAIRFYKNGQIVGTFEGEEIINFPDFSESMSFKELEAMFTITNYKLS